MLEESQLFHDRKTWRCSWRCSWTCHDCHDHLKTSQNPNRKALETMMSSFNSTGDFLCKFCIFSLLGQDIHWAARPAVAKSNMHPIFVLRRFLLCWIIQKLAQKRNWYQIAWICWINVGSMLLNGIECMVASFDMISVWRKFRWESWWFVPSLVSHVWQLSNPQSLIGLYPWWLLPYIENSSPQQFEPRIIADRKSTGWNYNSTVFDYTRLYLYKLIAIYLWTEDPKPTMNQLWSMMIVSVWTTHFHTPLKNGPQLPSVALLLHGTLSYPFCWAYHIEPSTWR